MAIYISWFDFLKLAISLGLLYLILKGVSKLLLQFFRRSLYKSLIKIWSTRIVILYVPFAFLVLVVAFVIINFKVHGILVLALGIILFQHIKNYFSGILFRVNPLVAVGVNLVTGDYEGKILKLLPLGLIIKVDNGERYIKYMAIDEQGFCVNQKVEGSIRMTLYILKSDHTDNIMELLFDNPLIDFRHKPTLRNISGETLLQLQFSLEKGAKIESIIAYLNQYNIKSSITKH